MSKVGIVYQWTNLENQKWYIGSHYGSLDDGYIASGSIFKKAYRKSKNKMIRSILYIGEDFRKAEEFYLLYLDAEKNRQSYNMKNTAIGGDTSHCFTEESRKKMSESSKNRVVAHSEETKRKISKSLSGRKLSKELREKMSERFSGETNPFYGKSHSDSTKIKISNANKGKRRNSIEFMKSLHLKSQKRVYSALIDKHFDSIKDCATHFNLTSSTISNMIANRTKNRFSLSFEMPKPVGVHTFAGCESLYLQQYCAKFPDSPYCVIPDA